MKEESLGERLKSLRTEMKVTQVEVAHAIGVSKGVISQWENNLRKPHYDYIIPLCNYFRVDPNYIYDYIN